MKMHGKIGVVLGVLLGAILFQGCKARTPETLVVGMELEYPPFETRNEKGEPSGVSVDLARELANYLGKELKIESIKFDGLIPALKTGKIDCIISSMTATEERAQSIDFSDPYLTTGLCLLVKKGSGIHSIEDLRSPEKKLAVKQGTTGHLYVTSKMEGVTPWVHDSDTTAALEVVQGKVDAFIYDQMSIYKYWKKYPDQTEAILKPFQEEKWAVGIQKGNTELRDSVNAFLKAFREKGGFDRLGDLYLKEQKDAFQQLGYPFYF